MDNLKEFKALIKRYESITLKDIKNSTDTQVSGEEIAAGLTGFGSADTCTLCKPTKDIKGYVDCSKCVYSKYTLTHCNDLENAETYFNISDSNGAENLLKAFKERAKYMKTVLKIKI